MLQCDLWYKKEKKKEEMLDMIQILAHWKLSFNSLPLILVHKILLKACFKCENNVNLKSICTIKRNVFVIDKIAFCNYEMVYKNSMSTAFIGTLVMQLIGS